MSFSGHFDKDWYIKAYPHIVLLGMDPLEHYTAYGQRLGYFPNENFNACVSEIVPRPEITIPEETGPALWRRVVAAHLDRKYYLKTYSDVREAGLDPVDHYINFGWREGRNPTPDFHSAYYLKNNPDVVAQEMNPFAHYILHGREEGRLPSSRILDLLALKPVEKPWAPSGKLEHSYDISVVIPTYNRAERLPSLLESWKVAHRSTRYSYELIFSDDGSSDDTLTVLEAELGGELPIKVLRNAHGGAASARNAAVAVARGAKVLFLGDDIYPDPDLINCHIEKLNQLPMTAAVLGNCDWHPDLIVNHLMRHITEIGCEQFSFAHLPQNAYTDFRHFYTCNVSVNREFLLSESVIFDEKFYKLNLEDTELGYRLALKGMQIFFFPLAYGAHHHSYADVRRFCMRQETAGEMALVFQRLHPEVVDIIPLNTWEQEWEQWLALGRKTTFDFQSSLTRLCQQTEERYVELDDTLRADLSKIYASLFHFCLQVGYVRAKMPDFNQEAANERLVEAFITEEIKHGLDKINARLDLADYAAFDDAWRGRPQLTVTSAPAAFPTLEAPPAVQFERVRLVVEARDMTHLDMLRFEYGDFDRELSFALKSDVRQRGMIYAPEPGEHIQRSNMAQLLLFNRLNPQVDLIVLSHGHYDLPELGIIRGRGPTILARNGRVRNGKVIRIYEGANVEAVPFDQALGHAYVLNDIYGYFSLATQGQ